MVAYPGFWSRLLRGRKINIEPSKGQRRRKGGDGPHFPNSGRNGDVCLSTYALLHADDFYIGNLLHCMVLPSPVISNAVIYFELQSTEKLTYPVHTCYSLR